MHGRERCSVARRSHTQLSDGRRIRSLALLRRLLCPISAIASRPLQRRTTCGCRACGSLPALARSEEEIHEPQSQLERWRPLRRSQVSHAPQAICVCAKGVIWEGSSRSSRSAISRPHDQPLRSCYRGRSEAIAPAVLRRRAPRRTVLIAAACHAWLHRSSAQLNTPAHAVPQGIQVPGRPSLPMRPARGVRGRARRGCGPDGGPRSGMQARARASSRA